MLRHGGNHAPRSVLMVLYHFPPNGGVSMSRNVSHIRYLPGHGWNPLVLAPRAAGEIADPGALALVPASLRVARATCPELAQLAPAVALLRGLAARASRARYGLTAGRSQPGAGTPPGQGLAPDVRAELSGPSHVSRLRRLLFFPDNQIAWLPFAVVEAIRFRRLAPYEVVYSSSSPVTAHLVAGVIKRLTGVPWVAEFRDPWVGNPIAEPLPWLHRRIRARLERWIARSADQLVFLSPSTLRLYRRRYPGVSDSMVLITNGHDRTEARPPTAGCAGPRRYRIVWTGSLYRPAELRMFLEAVRNLAARRPALSDELEVLFYGDVEASCRTVAERLTADSALDAIVQFRGFVPREVALTALADSDAALLMLGAGPGMGQFVPGKLFDYLGQSKQILAVLPPGDARDILIELGWGVIADPNAVDVERALERLLAAPHPTRAADPDGRYDRAHLAGRLADTFREAADGDHGGHTRRQDHLHTRVAG